MSAAQPLNLKQHLFLITGASGAIGGAVAQELSRRGARIVLVGRNGERLDSRARACLQAGASAVHPMPCDLDDDGELDRLAGEVSALGDLDGLIHSVGRLHAATLEETTAGELDLVFRTNTRGPLLLTQRLLPGLIRRQGQVVFVNSSAGLRSRSGFGPYAASKFALKAIADALREEVNERGVRVLTAYPGRTASDMQEALHEIEGKSYDPQRFLQPLDVALPIVQALELPRSAELTELQVRPMRKS